MDSAVARSKPFRWTHLTLLFLGGSVYPVINNVILYFNFPYKYGLTLGFMKPYFTPDAPHASYCFKVSSNE